MRLFTAIDIPKALHPNIAALRDTSLSGARWTNPHQWHITLHFIGETQHDAAIESALQSVQIADFTFRLCGVGTFPEKGKPRVLWIGIDAPPALQALYAAVGEALRPTGFQPETRPYHPHLTLARFKREAPSRNSMQAYLQRHADFASEAFAATAITLYDSQLSPSGARYTVRSQVPLLQS